MLKEWYFIFKNIQDCYVYAKLLPTAVNQPASHAAMVQSSLSDTPLARLQRSWCTSTYNCACGENICSQFPIHPITSALESLEESYRCATWRPHD
ncbi:hypothetical protein PISMIDRAFT_690561 [Pisolithus microcarpus 441]|uniref:Uncharacterized protein n=1 Tax=Pisolithus microcarpus 441 TaxID=765257 RepID=A0A0C9YTB5_9AGAM|nr:hypothetical protein PISMIDRAFT_690561 [Pisolithus microcarpus 441]